MTNSIISGRIKTLFNKNKSKRQKDLALLLGVNESTLSTWLKQGRDIPLNI